MKNILRELLQLLELEKLDTNLFRGQSHDLGFTNVFGGQVLGQALAAGMKTVTNRNPHSLHAYFLRKGDVKSPITYEVECIRDGKSFTTRRIVAKQHNQAILSMSASFQILQPGHKHQDSMPLVKGPEDLPSDYELAQLFKDKIPAKVRDKFMQERPIEIRSVDPIDPFWPEKRLPKKHSWLKTIDSLPDNMQIHTCLLVYASDFKLLATAMMPHSMSFLNKNLQITSLDHSMWFHEPARVDDWLLYSNDSPSASGARGFTRGQFFNQNGTLIASVSQEGLIRDYSLLEKITKN